MKLVDTFAELFAQIQLLFGDDEERHQSYDYQQLRSLTEAMLIEQQSAAQSAGYTVETINSARFAVFTLIDELVLSSNWDGRGQWRASMLQKNHFGTVQGGVEFFDRLQRLNPFNPLERDIREVFYYCLTLGFKGKYYRSEDEPQLRTLVDNNLQVLSDAPKDKIYPRAYESNYEKAIIPTTPIDWKPVFIAAPVLTWVAFYLYYKTNILTLIQKLIAEL